MLSLKEIENLATKYCPLPDPNRKRVYGFNLWQMKSRVKEIIPYRDKVRIWFKYCPAKIDLKIFNAFSDSRKFRFGVKPLQVRRKNKSTGKVNWGDHPDWRYSVILYQPEAIVFEYLKRQRYKKYLLNCLEVSLDFITANRCDAEYLHSFFESHWIKKYSKKSEMTDVRESEAIIYKYGIGKIGTTYFDERTNKVNFVIYSDKKSKIRTNEHCCHIEVRFQGHPVLKYAGKNAGFQLNKFEGHVDFNYRKFWEKYLILNEIRMDKLINAFYKKDQSYDKGLIERLIYRVGSISRQDIGKNKKFNCLTGYGISTQMIKQRLKVTSYYLKEISNVGFLPKKRGRANDYIEKIKKIRY